MRLYSAAERAGWSVGSAGTPSMQGNLSSDNSTLGSPRARSKRSHHTYHFAPVPQQAPRKRVGSVLVRELHNLLAPTETKHDVQQAFSGQVGSSATVYCWMRLARAAYLAACAAQAVDASEPSVGSQASDACAVNALAALLSNAPRSSGSKSSAASSCSGPAVTAGRDKRKSQAILASNCDAQKALPVRGSLGL